MSWPQWSSGTQPAVPTVLNTAAPVINSAPAVAPPGLQYTPEQWAQLQQQNWNQWAQWQQQYQQWHQQYGAEYQKSMNALAQAAQAQQQQASGLPNVAVPPPLPTEAKPPLPIDDPPPPVPSYTSAPPLAPQPGYNSAPPVPTQGYTTAPPVPQQGYNTAPPPPPKPSEHRPPVHYPKNNQNQTWQGQNYPYRNDGPTNKRSYDQGPDHEPKRPMLNKPGWQTQPPPTVQPQQKQANIEELSEAEKKFDKQFAEWEAQFNKWKEQNAEHPDKTQYKEYEKKWETWRAQLLERREQMRRKRLGLPAGSPNINKPGSGQPSQAVNSPQQGFSQPSQRGFNQSQQHSFNQPPPQGFNQPPPQGFNQPPPKVPLNVTFKPEGLSPVSTPSFTKPPPNLNDEPLKFKDIKIVPEPEEGVGDFIKPNTGGGIPGLDLVKDDPKPPQKDNIDIVVIDPDEKEKEKKGPDFEAISKGINTILGDKNLMNMLSKVSQNQNPVASDNLTTTISTIKDSSNPDQNSQQAPYPEQSNQSYEEHSNHSESFGQREFVNNFDDQTRSSFTHGDQETRFGLNQDRFGPGQERFGPGQNKFGANLDRLVPDQEKFSGGQSKFGSVPDKFGSGQDRFGPGQDRFGPGQERFPGQDRFGPGQDRFGPGQDRFGPGQDRFGPGQDRFGPGQDRFGPGQDRFGPGQERFGPGQDRFGPGQEKVGFDRFGSKQERFGSNQDRYGSSQERFEPNRFDPKQERFGLNQNRFGPNQERFGSQEKSAPNQEKFGGVGPNQGRFGRDQEKGQDRFAPGSDRFGSGLGQDKGGPTQGGFEPPPNRERFGSNQDKFGPNQGKFGTNQDKFRPNQDRFGPNQDRFGTNQDRFASNQDRFGSNQDKFVPNQDRFMPHQDRFGPNQDRFGPNQERFGFNQNKLGSGQERGALGQNRFGPNKDRFGLSDKFATNQDRFGSNQDRYGGSNNEDRFSSRNDQNFTNKRQFVGDEYNEEQLDDYGQENYNDYDYDSVAANFEEPAEENVNEPSWNEERNYKPQKYDTPPVVVAPEVPAPSQSEDIFQPANVIDYDHKSLKPSEPEILVEPLYMFDYRHKPLSRIPLPQRPKWLSETVKNIREFDPPTVRSYEPPSLRRYPPSTDNWRNDRYQDNWSPHNRRGYNDNRSSFDDRRSFGDSRSYEEGRSKNDWSAPKRDERRGYSQDRNTYHEERKPLFASADFEEEKISDTEWPEDLDEVEPQQNSQSNPDFEKVQKPPENKSNNKNAILIEDLINLPGRYKRPPRIVIILRGPPGSGKTFLAKLIKDKEVENGGSAPRILSLDDYFMVEQEKEITEEGKKVKVKEMVYEYEAEMEESYRTSLIKSFKKTITDGYFPFIIVDNINDKVKYFGEMWSFAKQNGFQVYICQLELDVQTCSKRNIHGRSEADIEKCVANWEATPSHHPLLDATSLLQSASISEVEMEEVNSPESEENEHDGSEDQVARSKWDNFDCSVDNLAKLDGVNKPLRHRTMEEYLQLDNDWTPNKPTKPGQKRVRWADLEEQKEQQKMRAIGFVVGHTNWDRMMDPSGGSSALTQTKYIEKIGRYKVDQK